MTVSPGDDHAKAAILAESLPWIRANQGAVIVIKYGGNAMTQAELQAAFAADVVLLRLVGLRPVVVHGGGPQIGAMLDRLGVTSEFVGGLRRTTPEVMEVVGMVLVGQVQRELVGLLNLHGDFAVGLSGEDAGLFTATRTFATIEGEQVDIGLVGDVVDVRPALVEQLLDSGYIPVVSTVAPDADGLTHNVNADTAAAALAVALRARSLVMLTDVAGLYADWPSSAEVISSITVQELRVLLPGLESGMRPKMQACMRAVEGGVGRAQVIDGRVPHALLREAFSQNVDGTIVTSSHSGSSDRP